MIAERDGLDSHRPAQWVRQDAFNAAGLDMRGERHPHDERQYRPDVGQRSRPLTLRAVDGEEDHVGGLDIGEHPAAGDVGVGVEEPVGQRQQQGEPQASGALGVRWADEGPPMRDNVARLGAVDLTRAQCVEHAGGRPWAR